MSSRLHLAPASAKIERIAKKKKREDLSKCDRKPDRGWLPMAGFFARSLVDDLDDYLDENNTKEEREKRRREKERRKEGGRRGERRVCSSLNE